MTEQISATLLVEVHESDSDTPGTGSGLTVSAIYSELMIALHLNGRSLFALLNQDQVDDLVKQLSVGMTKPPAQNAWASITKQ